MKVNELLNKLHAGDRMALARCISLVENDSQDSSAILENLKINHEIPVVGITGPPGAGKSTLVNALVSYLSEIHPGCKIGILAVDPTSPFTQGSLLGDRLRMTEHFNNPDVFIRSLATRGALGGLSARTFEIIDVLKSAQFDFIFIETVGVGQSEVEIAALADTTVVVFVPESGDDIQTIKSGIMEIADIFVVNKSDREGADKLVKNLQTTLHERKFTGWNVPVIKTVASVKEGIPALYEQIRLHGQVLKNHPGFRNLIFSKAVRLAQHHILRKVDIESFRKDLDAASQKSDFNIYRFVSGWFS